MNRFRYRRPPRIIPGTAEDILSYLETHGTRDKDRQEAAETAEAARMPEKPVQRGKGGVPRLTLDLHGLTSDEASGRVYIAVEECGRKGIKELLVIHGRGRHSDIGQGPVLKNLVLRMLDSELSLRVRNYRGGLPREGGEGVTVVYLR